MIEIRNLTVRYGELVAANRISLSIPDGEVFGLVGPNGAGKTTTIKVMAGLLLPDEGNVSVDGRDIVLERSTVQSRIGYMADFFGVYDYLTCSEYLGFFGAMYGLTGDQLSERVAAMLETTGIREKQFSYVKTLSRGMKQRLYLARALVHDPDLLLLDEPASGMDPRGRAEFIEMLKRIHSQGKTIFISSHILSEMQDLCTSVGIMEAGRLVGVKTLRSDDGAVKTCRVILPVAAGDIQKALSFLEKRAGVSDARLIDGQIHMSVEDSDDAIAGVVRDLVQAGIRVVLPRTDFADLKEIFMKMTKGQLM